MQKNKINIIFLDVDGVLNSRSYLNSHKDPEDEIDMRLYCLLLGESFVEMKRKSLIQCTNILNHVSQNTE